MNKLSSPIHKYKVILWAVKLKKFIFLWLAFMWIPCCLMFSLSLHCRLSLSIWTTFLSTFWWTAYLSQNMGKLNILVAFLLLSGLAKLSDVPELLQVRVGLKIVWSHPFLSLGSRLGKKSPNGSTIASLTVAGKHFIWSKWSIFAAV